MKKIKEVFSNLKKELERVKWPTFKEVTKNTSTTILFVIFFGAFFYLISIGFAAFKGLFN